MAPLVLKDATTFYGGYDLTSHINEVALELSAEPLDDSTMGDAWRSRIAGAKDVSFNHKGYVEFAEPDATLEAALATAVVQTMSVDGTDGAVAYMLVGLEVTYQLFGDYGSVAPFMVQGSGSNGFGAPAGKLLYPKQTIAAADNGTGQQLGAVAAGERLYTTVHCFTAGTTVDVIVESDDNSGFTSATTRSTTTVTATGGTWVTPVAGAITDDWWRVRIATITGSFSLAAAVGIA